MMIVGQCGKVAELHYHGNDDTWPDLNVGQLCTGTVRNESSGCLVLDNMKHVCVQPNPLRKRYGEQVVPLTLDFDLLSSQPPYGHHVHIVAHIQRAYSMTRSKKGTGRKYAVHQFHGTISSAATPASTIPFKAVGECAPYLHNQLTTSASGSVHALLLNVLPVKFGKSHQLQIHFDRRSHLVHDGSELFSRVVSAHQPSTSSAPEPACKRSRTNAS